MINRIDLNFGSKGKVEPLSFDPGSVTIFVGPNNSGKSLLLREIEGYCKQGLSANNIILKDLDFDFSDDSKITDIIERHKIEFRLNERQEPGQVKYGKMNSAKGFMQQVVNPEALLQWKNNKSSFQNFCSHFINLFSARFSGKERFQLVGDAQSGDLKSTPNSNLMALFQHDAKRAEVRELIFQAFEKYFVIDATDMGKLKINLSDVSPPSPEVERGWHNEAVSFHKNAMHISSFSDGVQAFTGLVLATLVGNEKYIFIDEPEAFLHPHLSCLLGRKLSDLMSDRDGNLIVSTHSPHFVMGCIQSGNKVNIVRLTYDGRGNATARILPSDKLNELFKNPLLRSTGTMQALFFSNVIVTEADADRAFYNEINERMVSQPQSNSVPNCLFINAQNKQTIWTILKPLRELGIPAAAIVDIDVLKDGGKEFTDILQAAQIPEGLHASFQQLRASLKSKFEATGKNMKRDGGIGLLGVSDQAVFKKFVDDLKEYGVFVLENGELESWLPSLSVTGHGPSWLINMFTKMGDDPEQEHYMHPTNDDVWAFINVINTWFKNPNRKGIG
jgi:predicted ATPase